MQILRQYLGDVGLETVTVDRSVQYDRRDYACHAKIGHQRVGLTVTVWESPIANARLLDSGLDCGSLVPVHVLLMDTRPSTEHIRTRPG